MTGDLLLPTAPRTGESIPSAPHEHDDGKRAPRREIKDPRRHRRSELVARELVIRVR